MRTALIGVVALALLVVSPAAQTRAAKTFDIDVVDVEGGNATLFVSPSGESLLMDTGNGGALTDKVQGILRAISTRPIRYILNTSFRPDHTGGNDPMRGATGGGGRLGAGGPGGRARGTPNAAHENVLGRMSAPTGKAQLCCPSRRALAGRPQ